MDNFIYNSLDKYFKALSNLGYINYNEVENLLILLALDDLKNSQRWIAIWALSNTLAVRLKEPNFTSVPVGSFKAFVPCACKEASNSVISTMEV